jgi:hypothetical protein
VDPQSSFPHTKTCPPLPPARPLSRAAATANQEASTSLTLHIPEPSPAKHFTPSSQPQHAHAIDSSYRYRATPYTSDVDEHRQTSAPCSIHSPLSTSFSESSQLPLDIFNRWARHPPLASSQPALAPKGLTHRHAVIGCLSARRSSIPMAVRASSAGTPWLFESAPRPPANKDRACARCRA